MTLLESDSLSAENVLPATSQEIQYIGRCVFEDDSATLAFPGQRITVAFEGTSISFAGTVLHGGAFFNANIDGKELARVDLKEGGFARELASGLSRNESHLLTLTRRNESWQGVVRIEAFTLSSDGSLLAAPDAPKRKILCIGDSITCGEAADLIPPATPGIHNENAEAAYGWQLGKDFGAQVNLVSYGGKGLTRDWQGLTTEVTAPQFFERALPDSPEPKWDHSRFAPDLVIIALGTNDFGQGIPDEAQWVEAYIAFLKRIREVHPDTPTLLLSGPTFGEGDINRITLERYLSKAVEGATEIGIEKVRTHFLAAYPGGALDEHPDAPQHRQMADEIGETIERWLGWKR